jgi:hypothetical protein
MGQTLRREFVPLFDEALPRRLLATRSVTMQPTDELLQEHPLVEYLRQEILPTTHCPGCGCGQVLNAFVNAVHDLQIDPTSNYQSVSQM